MIKLQRRKESDLYVDGFEGATGSLFSWVVGGSQFGGLSEPPASPPP